MRHHAALAVLLAALAATPPLAGQSQAPHAVPQPHPRGDAPEPLLTREVLARGQERYDIFCAPCHGFAGYGDGIVVEHGFPAPPSFHAPAQRDLTMPHIVGVITNGTGRMLPMAERIPPADRWAIATYVKALQLSQQEPGDGTGDGMGEVQ